MCEVTAWGHLDAVQFEPRLHVAQLVRETRRNDQRVLTRLDMRALHHQHLALSVCFQVAATDKRVPEQEREHVVAVHPFGWWRVQLDGVLHPEQPLDTA